MLVRANRNNDYHMFSGMGVYEGMGEAEDDSDESTFACPPGSFPVFDPRSSTGMRCESLSALNPIADCPEGQAGFPSMGIPCAPIPGYTPQTPVAPAPPKSPGVPVKPIVKIPARQTEPKIHPIAWWALGAAAVCGIASYFLLREPKKSSTAVANRRRSKRRKRMAMPNGQDAVIKLLKGMMQGKSRCVSERTYKRAEESGLIKRIPMTDDRPGGWVLTERGKVLGQIYGKTSMSSKPVPSEVPSAPETLRSSP